MSDYTNVLRNMKYLKKESKILFVSADFNKELVTKHENLIKGVLSDQ